MARKSQGAPDEEQLSTKMRDLILTAKVEERRNPDTAKRSLRQSERRRRTDQKGEQKDAS